MFTLVCGHLRLENLIWSANQWDVLENEAGAYDSQCANIAVSVVSPQDHELIHLKLQTFKVQQDQGWKSLFILYA